MLRFLVIFFVATNGWGQAAQKSGIVHSWQVIGFSGDDIASQKALLKSTHEQITNGLLLNPTTLDRVATGNGIQLSINQKQLASAIRSGTPKGNFPADYVAFQPIACVYGDQGFVAIEVSSVNNNTLLLSNNIAVRVGDPKKKRPALKDVLSQDLGQLIASSARFGKPSLPYDESAMLIGMSLAKNNTVSSKGALACLNVLLASELADDYALQREIGNNELPLVRKVFGITSRISRATRTLTVDWQTAGSPKDVVANLRVSESVLGGRIKTEQLTMTFANDKDLKKAPLGTLSQVLDREKQALALNESPKVVKVDRGWVYLSKGRAWGLEIDDRLFIEKDGVQIAGHVVGFFGPFANIKTSSGDLVSEGAIVFVRQGQRETEIGQIVSFDPRQYPASLTATK